MTQGMCMAPPYCPATRFPSLIGARRRSFFRRWAAGVAGCLAATAMAASTDSPWSFRVWQSDDGLPNNNVTGLAQTPDGYLWLATPTRLVRFDGDHFENISRSIFAPGSTERTSKLLQSADGGLWLALDHGPVIYAKAGVIHSYTNDLPDQIVESLTEDGERALWIVYRGDQVCRLKDGKLTRYGAPDGLPAWSRCSLACDRNGQLWFAKGGEIGWFHAGRFQSRFRLTGQTTVIRITAANTGGLWACTGSELTLLDGTGAPQQRWNFPPEMAGGEPIVLLEGRNGGVWIGTSDRGLFHFDGSRFETVPTSHHDIVSLLEDREGNIWAGTGGGGLNQIQPRAVVLENAASGLPFESLQSVCEDNAGVLWAATQNGLLVCRSNGVWSTVSTNENWPGGLVTCVTADKSGAVWVGTRSLLLHRLQHGRFTTWRTTDGLASHIVHALLVSRDGDLWIGGNAPESLQRLRDGHFQNFVLPPRISVIRALAEDAEGTIWVGSAKGALLRVSGNQLVNTGTEMTPTNSIRTLLASADGSLWIGYAGWGVGLLKNGQIARITSERGLFDDYVSQIISDGKGWLWFGADHGIFKVREAELSLAIGTPNARVQSIHYGRSEGLPSLQANFDESPNCWRSRDGCLWLPMSTALAVVDPRRFHENPEPSPVLLKRVLVDDAPVASYGGVMPVSGGIDLRNSPAPLRLPPGHRRLEFDFTALSFGAPENMVFQYRLKGFDDRWIEAGTQRNAIYSRLPAGNYQFEVRGRNSDGVWNQTDATLAFSVAPFFWQTWWFRLATVGLFTLGVIAAVRYVSFQRLQSKVRQLEQQAALDKERGRIARDIHDHLGGSLTQMTLQLELALRNRARPEKADHHVQRSLDTARQVIKSLDETVWAVNPGNDTLPHLIDYIGEYAVEFLDCAGIRCRLDLPDDLPGRPVAADARYHLFLAAKEALNNIVRHAEATEVRLRANVHNGSLVLVVEDNGRGVAPAAGNAGADGLRNMRQRMEEIGGRFELESNAGGGTRISFVWPWQNGH